MTQGLVLVTDAEERSALAACRGLHRAGYRVAAASSCWPATSHWSRSVTRRIALPDPCRDTAEYLERLEDLVRTSRFDAAIASTEASLLLISEGRERLEPFVCLGLPSHATVLRAFDKLAVQQEAETVDLAPPPSVVCSSAEEAQEAGRDLGFPVVAKPLRSFTVAGRGLRHNGTHVASNPESLAGAVEALGTPLTVQKYTSEASVVSLAGVRVGGQLRGLTVARYARTFPIQAGSASMAVTIDPPAGLLERVSALLERMGWEGIFELELLELRSGGFAAIDLNPRLFGWMTLTVTAGANLPAIWCDHLLDRASVPTAPARPGVCYRWDEAEVRYLGRQLRAGRLAAALAVLRPRRKVAHAQFRLDDPGPLFARMVFVARRWLAGRGRRTRRSGN